MAAFYSGNIADFILQIASPPACGLQSAILAGFCFESGRVFPQLDHTLPVD
jgi:hypothetical protein